MNGDRYPYELCSKVVLSLLVITFFLVSHAKSAPEDSTTRIQVSNEFISTLSEQERTWLQKHPVIRVVQDPDWPPVEFTNEQGQFSGISEDYLNLVEQRLGVKFERVKNLSWLEAFARLKRWEIDMTTSVAVTPQRTDFWAFTKPYLSIPIVIATQMDVTYIGDIAELFGKDVAVVENYAIDDWLSRDFPEIKRIHVKKTLDGLEMLQRGEVFAYIDNLLIIGYYQAKMKVSSIKIAGQTPYVNAQCMAVRKDWAPLAEILQKALESIPEKQRSDIYRKWLPVRYEHGFNHFLFWQILGVFAAILLALVIWNRKMAREIESRRQAEEALRKSEIKYRLIAENTADLISILDMNLHFTYVSPSIMCLRGFTVEEAMEQTLEQILTHESLRVAMDFFETEMLLEAGGAADPNRTRILELEEYKKDGSTAWMDVSFSYLRDKDLKPIEIITVSRDITEQKQTLESLRETNAYLNNLFNYANAPIIVWNPQFNITRFNRAFESLTGRSSQEVIGLSLEILFPPMQVESSMKLIKKTMEGERWETVEIDIQHRDGHVRTLMWNSATLFAPDGKTPMAAIAQGHDITDRKRAEEAQKASLSLLRASIESTADGLLIVNNEGKVTIYNQKFTEMWKIPDEVLVSHDDDVLLNHVETQVADPGQFSAKVREMYSNPEEISLDQISFKDGRVFERYSQPQKIGNSVVGRVWSFRDITERKRSEETLRDSEERLRILFHGINDAVFVHEGQENGIPGRFIEVNDSACEQLGYSRNELLTMCPTDIDAPETIPNIPKIMELLYTKGSAMWEGVHVRKDGTRIQVEIGNHLVRLEGRQVIISTVRDISKRKRAEEEKAKLETQLQQAQKMESIGSLAGGIAHDLNNILFPISGLSEMLLDDIPPDTPEHENIEQIYKSAQRGSELVKQILAFSRQSKPQKLPIRIQSVLKEVLKLVRSTIPANIDIKSHINSDCGLVSADPTQVHQIAMNLITNAYHAVERKGGTIDIELKEKVFEKDDLHDILMKPGKYACINISDTGTGIDQSMINIIFDPYFTTKELGKGTGLGLSVVHGIVKEHGGDIRVYSEVGKGTTFNVYLPLLEETMEGKTAAVARKYPTGTENILLVDDEEPIAKMVQMMLERLGYKVTTRTSSPDAFKAFIANPSKFDLVISDRGMPNMTGEQLAKELISIKPEIPILLCTGFAEESDELLAKELGIIGLLKKPVAIADLAEMVRKVLDELKGTTP